MSPALIAGGQAHRRRGRSGAWAARLTAPRRTSWPSAPTTSPSPPTGPGSTGSPPASQRGRLHRRSPLRRETPPWACSGICWAAWGSSQSRPTSRGWTRTCRCCSSPGTRTRWARWARACGGLTRPSGTAGRGTGGRRHALPRPAPRDPQRGQPPVRLSGRGLAVTVARWSPGRKGGQSQQLRVVIPCQNPGGEGRSPPPGGATFHSSGPAARRRPGPPPTAAPRPPRRPTARPRRRRTGDRSAAYAARKPV